MHGVVTDILPELELCCH